MPKRAISFAAGLSWVLMYETMDVRILKQLESREDEILSRTWKAIEEQGVDTGCLAEFRTQTGRLYRSPGDPISIMVAGRASNGWRHGEVASDRAHLFPDHGGAFIAVSRLIAGHFFHDECPEDHLVWTNMAHVADIDSGNPTKGIWAAQHTGSCEVACAEQELLLPDVTIVMTGTATEWDSPLWDRYLNSHGCSEVIMEGAVSNSGGRVCRMLAYECDRRLFIISDRPEWFCRADFANAVIGLIEKWRAGDT